MSDSDIPENKKRMLLASALMLQLIAEGLSEMTNRVERPALTALIKQLEADPVTSKGEIWDELIEFFKVFRESMDKIQDKGLILTTLVKKIDAHLKAKKKKRFPDQGTPDQEN